MSITLNEIEGSQMGAALVVGNGATSNYLKELRYNIGVIRDIANQYCKLTVKDMNARIHFVLYFVLLLKLVNEHLPKYIDDLKKGACVEVFCISANQYRAEPFWSWCDEICRSMEGQQVYCELKCHVDKLNELLAEAEKVIRHYDPMIFEKFFFCEKQNYQYEGVQKRFEDWKYENFYPGIEKLSELQAQVVAEALKKGILDFALEPSYKEKEEVQVEVLRDKLPSDFVMDEVFIEACAKWRKFMHWEGPILVIDYKRYGKYVQNHYYEFNAEQLQAIFEMDMMMHLINEEMQKLMATEQQPDDETTVMDLLQDLKPLFYNNEYHVREFLKEIEGMTPNDITDLVNQWVKDKRISDYGNSRKGVLWGILYKAGLYTKSRQNWNRRVF